jgi:hypothetical protein
MTGVNGSIRYPRSRLTAQQHPRVVRTNVLRKLAVRAHQEGV